MKYYFGAVCFALAAWLVYRGLGHRRRVQESQARAREADRPSISPYRLKELQSLRSGCGPMFVLLILLFGLTLAGLWMVIDRGRILSVWDIAGLLTFMGAYAYSMTVRLQYSVLGTGTGTGGDSGRQPAASGEADAG